MNVYQMTAKTLEGLEGILAGELAQMGAQNVMLLKRAVAFEGDDDLMMRANLCLRTATQVLIPWAIFDADNESELYNEIFRLPWSDMFGLNNTFSVQAIVSGEHFTHSKFVALKAKDAIADKFRKLTGKRPNVDTQDADYQINIHIHQQRCTLSLNSSGKSLDKRGYRLKANEAPLNEALAAGIILKTGWNDTVDFYDPMSGSGTFGIEAALLAAHIAPGLHRTFAFEHWNDFNQKNFVAIKDELKAKIRPPSSQIYCSDIAEKNCMLIKENAERANIASYLNVASQDFFQSQCLHQAGLVCINPPYGERLNLEDGKAFYKRIGDQLKQAYKNCEAWVISSNEEGMKSFGLRPESRTRLNNGGLECLLQHYKLF